ncbi:MAG: hypothetical protein IJD13_06775 [Oscillospiraceae bacterium]|nr:hypothetical protein [Oscillospiraceae bacterium]
MKTLIRIFTVLGIVLTAMSAVVLVIAKLNPAVTVATIKPDPADSDEASVSPDETVHIIEHMGPKLKPVGFSLLGAGVLSGIAAAVLAIVRKEK